jgi:hypothetical protein
MRLVKPVIVSSLGAVLLSCSANPQPRVLPDLLARKPVCLALDWGTSPPPDFFGWTAPDTLVLLPGSGEDLGHADSAGVEGRVTLAGSQQDRKGGGWIWWTHHDTLVISSMSPTMDDLVVFAVRPEGKVPADWRGSGMAEGKRGQVGLSACHHRAQVQ